MPITEQGLVIRRFPEVESDIQESLVTNLNTALVFDNDTLLGQLISIIGAEIADKEALLQSIYDSFDIQKAEGESLDRLVALIGLARLEAAKTAGSQEFIGVDGTTIPIGTLVANPSSLDQFETAFALSLTPSDCEQVIYLVSSVMDSTIYTVEVNGNDFSFTSGIGATEQEIVDGLASEINLPSSKTWQADNIGDQLSIITTDLSNISVNAITFLVAQSITSSIFAQATVTGDIRGPANSITQIVTAISGLVSTNNPLSFATGRLAETDEELRARASLSTQLAGSSTVPANLSTISNVEGVTAVLLVENLTSTTDLEGRPPHSYEVIVQGGVDGDIAIALFSEKPAGILTYGDITVNVLDTSETVRAVSFSRPEEIFVAVRATYSLYDEESFPITGATDIANIILETGNDLGIGEDVIPKRFYGPIYGGVSGINDLIVEVQILAFQGETPNPVNWTEDKIDVSDSQISTFNISDIFTVQT